MSDDWPEAGTLLAARYRLVTLLETGGMAEVWRAEDELLGRPVAVKLPTGSQVVWREARMAAKLQHPGIAAVHDYREAVRADGTVAPFVVMELLAGESVAAHLEREAFGLPEAARIGAAVADALAAAHANGVVHRDIKPGNVMLTPTGVKILDFGISAAAGEPDDDDTGATFGTPAYVAPERLDGMPAVPPTDVYGLGVLLFEMVTGDPPYPVETWEELAEARAKGPGVLPDDLPAAFRDLVGRCLDEDPSARPGAEQVRFDLTALWLALSETYAGKQADGAAAPEAAAATSRAPGDAGDGQAAGAGPFGAAAAGGPPGDTGQGTRRGTGATGAADDGEGRRRGAGVSGEADNGRGRRRGAVAGGDGGQDAQHGTGVAGDQDDERHGTGVAGDRDEWHGTGVAGSQGAWRAGGVRRSGQAGVSGMDQGSGRASGVPERGVPDRVGDGPRVAEWVPESAGFARGRAATATLPMERQQPVRRRALSLTLVALLVALGAVVALINWRPNRGIEAGPEPATPATASTPPARVFETPSPAPSTTSASPPPSTSPTPPRLTFAEAISRTRAAVEEGVDAGEIRSDVATDLLNLLRNMSGAQGPDVEAQIDHLRDKVRQRVREGTRSMTSGRGAVILARLTDLDRAAGS